MAQQFKKYLVTFLLLHLIFAVILLIGDRLVTDDTRGESFSYLFLFVIMFGLVAPCVLSLVFTFVFSTLQLNKLLFFISAFIIDLVIANLLLMDAGDGHSLTVTLLNEINDHTPREQLSVSWLVHVALLLATAIIVLVRPVEVVKD